MFKQFSILLIFLLVVSCSSGPNDEGLSYRVTRKTFENVLYVEGTVQAVRSTALTVPMSVYEGTIVFMVEDGTFVEEGELVCILEEARLTTRYDELALEVESNSAELNKTKLDLAMQYAQLESQVKTNEAQTNKTMLDSLQLAYATPNQRKITELELQSAKVEREKLLGKLEAMKVIQQTDIKAREYRLQRKVGQMEQVKRQLDDLKVYAPHAGLALRAYSWETGEKYKVGDVAYRQDPLLTIPELSSVKVLIQARENDYKHISVNDSVHYVFSATPGKFASGRILKKSPIGQPVARNSTVKMFEIEASVDRMDQLPEPGFSASCYVTLSQVRDTLVIPQLAVFDQDSMKVVYISRGKGYEMREVRLGLASPKEVIVTEGLQEGEVVFLMRPQASRIKKTTKLPVAETSPVPETPAPAPAKSPVNSMQDETIEQ